MKITCESCGDTQNYTKKNSIYCNIEGCDEKDSIICLNCSNCISCGNEFDPDIETDVESSESYDSGESGESEYDCLCPECMNGRIEHCLFKNN